MKKSNKASIIKWGILVFLVLIINFYELPYYFTIPGDAKVLTEVIEVEDGHEYDGTFMLTTIRMGKANIVNYVWAMFSDDRELMPEKRVKPEGESDEEYRHRQLLVMANSQESAVLVAYDRAEKNAYYENEGVLVTSLIPGMDAEEKLELGDKIVAVDEEGVLEADKLLELLELYDVGDKVPLTIERGEGRKSVSIQIMPFPEEIGEGHGLGIANPMTARTLMMEPDVDIDTDEIGGPSAGLMFSLEIYNQLVEEDMTKGYNIAGTGTIDEDGNVGSIGGVHQKVVAADNAGAKVFFAPYENGAEDSNFEVARKKAESIGTDMVVVPVDTFEDALNYLKGLPDK